MTEPAPPVGSMQLYDAVRPTMSSGAYRLTSTVAFTDPAMDSALSSAVHRDFVTVGGSAVRFQPTEVLGCHPPRNATGGFADELPHVVLRRRTLPWERQGPGGSPWLALLVFADSEVSFSSGTLGDLLPASVVGQFGTDAAGAGDRVDVVQVADPAVLTATLPTTGELGLLCHVRRVNLQDTTLDIGDDDGWLAVVAANRLPVAVDGSQTHYHACLVSVEHREDVYGNPTADTRLLLLYRWDFITASDGTFEYYARNLDVATLGAAGDVTDAAGRVPLAAIQRDGTPETVAYRGPFGGGSADIEDGEISYDAAYELGRLLAAADGPLTRELVDWHRSAAAASQTAVHHAAVRSRSAAGTGVDTGVGEEHPSHVRAAAAGIDALLRALAPRAPHRPAAGGDGRA